MTPTELEQIAILLDAFKWLMGLFGVVVVLAAKFVWSIYKSLGKIENTNATRDEKISTLEKNHDKLHNYVYQKN